MSPSGTSEVEVSEGKIETTAPAGGPATFPANHPWTRLPRLLAVVGVAGLGATFGLADLGVRGQLFFSYLVAFLFFLSLALGGLFFVLVHFATRAGWSVVVRRQAETAMMTKTM